MNILLCIKVNQNKRPSLLKTQMNKIPSKLFKRAMIRYTHLKYIFKRLGKASKKVGWAQPIKTSKCSNISELDSGKS